VLETVLSNLKIAPVPQSTYGKEMYRNKIYNESAELKDYLRYSKHFLQRYLYNTSWKALLCVLQSTLQVEATSCKKYSSSLQHGRKQAQQRSSSFVKRRFLDLPRHLTSYTLLEQSLQNTGTYCQLEITITTQLHNKSSQEEAVQFQTDDNNLSYMYSLIEEITFCKASYVYHRPRGLISTK